MRREEGTITRLENRYDGFKIALGMSASQVESIYGPPVKSLDVGKGQTARIYGRPDYDGKIADSVAFCCHAVIFGAGGKATAIYSDAFFSENWVQRGSTVSASN